MLLWCLPKFQLNPTYGLVGDVVWRISRWLPWQLSWISEWNDFSNSETMSLRSSFSSICLMVWEMSFEEFQDGLGGGHLGYRNGTISAILNFYVNVMPGSHLGYRNGMIFTILNLHVATMPPTNSAQSKEIVWRTELTHNKVGISLVIRW